MARGRGHPKKFESGEELITLWEQFCKWIIDNDYNLIPTQTNFCNWLADNYEEVDRKTIYNSLEKYFPSIKKQFEETRADMISQGAMIGKWNSTMSIFCLKNWCSWRDKQEIQSTEETKVELFLKELNPKNEKNMD